MTGLPSALSFDRVTRTFGAIRALDGVSFGIQRGEMFGVIGPDGAGKTTAIRLACGLLRPTSGMVRVLGSDPVAQHRHVTGAIGYLSQRFSLYGDLTIDENIAFFAQLHGVSDYGPARDRLLNMTQLTRFRGRRADKLSGGMKQKLALACTLVHEPELLLLDEPTTGVDPVARREFWKLLSEFLARGLTVVMSTPYLDEAERCGRVLLLHEGRVLALDQPSVLQRALAGRIVEVVTTGGRPPIEILAALPGVRDAQVFGDRAHVHIDSGGSDAAVQLIADLGRRGVNVRSVRPVAASLEDVFIGMLRS